MRKFRKALYSLSLLSSLFVAPAAEAKIPWKSFKKVTRFFRAGQEFNSPVLGEAALESGLIFNLRFYGHITSNVKEGARQYIFDKGNDDMSKLIKALLPSPAGGLSAMTDLNTNFGKLATDPKVVSLLMNYAHKVRSKTVKNWKATNKNAVQEMLQTLTEGHPELGKKEQERITADINEIINAIRLSIDNEGKAPYPKYMTEQVITAFLCERYNTPDELKRFFDSLDDDIVDRKILNDPQQGFNAEQLLSIDDYRSTLDKDRTQYTVDDIFVLAHPELETNLITPYKPGTHLLSNGSTYFFKRSQDGLGDILFLAGTFADCAEMALRHLLNLILYDAKENIFDLQYIRKYGEENAPDNPYFANFLKFFERQKPDSANDGSIAMRSLFNAVVADLNAFQRKILIDYSHGTNEVNPDFLNYINIFRIVVGLKVEEPPKELPKQKQWLENSFLELLRALNPTYDYELGLSQVDEKKNHLTGSLGIRVKDKQTGDTAFSFELDSEYNKHAEVSSLQNPNVIALEGEGPSFKRAFDSEEVMNLLFPESDLAEKTENPVYTLFSGIMGDDASRIDKLKYISDHYAEWNQEGSLYKPHMGLIQSLISHTLENMGWEDDTTLLPLSKLLEEMLKQQMLTEPLRHQVKGFATAWADLSGPEIAANFPKVRKLQGSHKALQDYEWVKDLRELEVVNIRNLDVLEKPHGEKLPLNGLTNLRQLNLERSSFKVEGLEDLVNLQGLNVSQTKMQELDVSRLTKLQKLHVSDSQVSKLVGLENLKDLQTLEANETTHSEFVVKDLPNLASLSLWEMSSKTVELSNLPNVSFLNIHPKTDQSINNLTIHTMPGLESLQLWDVDNARIENAPKLKKIHPLMVKDTLELRNLDGLESLYFSSQSLSSLILGNLSSLRDLDLETQTGLKLLSLKDLRGLKSLSLPKSPIHKTEGIEELRDLQDLSLSSSQWESFDLSKFESLESLNLSWNKIKNLTGLTSLTHLKELKWYDIDVDHLDVSPYKHLETLYISGDKYAGVLDLSQNGNLKTLDMSRFKAGTHKGLEKLSLLEELNLHASHIDRLDISSFSHLRKLGLSNTGISDLVGLESASTLGEINLEGSKLKELNVGKNRELTFLELNNSLISRLHGLQNLEKLIRVDVTGCKDLTGELSLSKLPQLTSLSLRKSGVESLVLEDMDSLQVLNLKEMPGLKRVEFKGSFKSLHYIDGMDNPQIQFIGRPKFRHEKEDQDE